MSTANEMVVLPEALTIAHVEALFETLGRQSEQSRLTLDGSIVELADTAGLQLLMALRQRLMSQGGNLEWQGISPALAKAMTDLGVAALIVGEDALASLAGDVA